jgi:two-component system LytT family response regulator
MSMAFGMKVIGFMKKPVLYEQMVRWIQVARKELEEICITYESDSGPNVIEEEKILFIQAAGDYTYLYQVERKEPELVTHSVKYWENLLSQGSFVRVHKSFFVNLRYIMQIENNTIMLDGGREKLPIGRVYKKQVEERFHAYIIETIRNRVQ